MGKTFKDMTSYKMIKVGASGRESSAPAGKDSEGKDGYARATREGRHQTFLNEAQKPPTFKGEFMHKYNKQGK